MCPSFSSYATGKQNTASVWSQTIWYSQLCKVKIIPDMAETAPTPTYSWCVHRCPPHAGITQLPDSYFRRWEQSWKTCCFLSRDTFLLEEMTVPCIWYGEEEFALGLPPCPYRFPCTYNLRGKQTWDKAGGSVRAGGTSGEGHPRQSIPEAGHARPGGGGTSSLTCTVLLNRLKD